MSGPGLVVRRQRIEGDPLTTRRYAGLSQRFVPASAWRSLGTFCVDTTAAVFALTYDDGPHPVHTPRILDVLAAHGARATFFALTGPAAAHPDVVHRIVTEGHQLALHGRDHTSLLHLSTRAARDSVADARDTLEGIGQTRVTLYRPPYGQHTFAQARAVDRLGLEVAVWSADATDWVDDAEDDIASRAWRGVHPGGVLLLHDDRSDPPAVGERAPAFDRAGVLDRLLTRLRDSGMSSTTMSALLQQGARVRSIAWERTRR